MPSFTVNIPTDALQSVLNGFADRNNWTEKIPDVTKVPQVVLIDNPVSKQQNAKNQVVQLCKDMFKSGEVLVVKESNAASLVAATSKATTDAEDITI